MLDGVCITGGEPTIQPDLRGFIEKIKALGLLVKLDTNGIHPHAIQTLIDAGLVDYFAMDLKHRWERYADVTRVAGERSVQNCRDTFAIIQASGVDHEFRTTLLPGTHAAEDLFAMAGYLKDGETYYIQDFRSGKTLEQNIPADTGFNTVETVLKLRNAFPQLIIQSRS
jgi:pyruvate formate lyase activating enzyme